MNQTKTLLLNGVVVGEIEFTGDMKTDAKVAMDFLKAKGLYREIGKVEQIFRSAFAFAMTASDLYDKHLTNVPRYGPVAVPFVVNAAFAIELYLKTLHQADGQQMRGHSLLELFDALTAARRAEIVAAAQENAPRLAVSVKDESEFRATMDKLNNVFVEWRYIFEKDYSGEVTIQPTILAVIALESVCKAAGAAGPGEPRVEIK